MCHWLLSRTITRTGQGRNPCPPALARPTLNTIILLIFYISSRYWNSFFLIFQNDSASEKSFRHRSSREFMCNNTYRVFFVKLFLIITLYILYSKELLGKHIAVCMIDATLDHRSRLSVTRRLAADNFILRLQNRPSTIRVVSDNCIAIQNHFRLG